MSSLPLQWTPYALLPVVTAALASFVVIRLARERRHQSVTLLRGLLLAIAIWSLGNTIETVATTIPGKLLGLRTAYPGVVAVPVLFLIWLCAYLEHLTGRKRKLTLVLVAWPVVAWGLAITSDLHSLVWYDVRLTVTDGFVGWEASRGWAWRVQLYYGYGLILVAWGLLAYEYVTARWARQHVLLLFFASCIPVVPSVIYVSGLTDMLLRADVTPSAFALSVAWLATLAEDPMRRRLPISRSRIIAAMRQPVIVTDPAGRIVSANPAACRLLGAREDALDDQDATQLLPFLELAEHASGTHNFEIRGDTRVLETRIAPVRDRWNQLLGWIIQFSDRTEEVRLETAMERAVVALGARADALEEAGQAKTSFLATVSHELRTPLGAIIGFAELMKDGMAGTLTEAEREIAVDIHETGNDLLDHVNSLLDLEKSEAGALELRPDPVQVDRVGAELGRGFRRRLARADVELVLDAPKTGAVLMLDAGKIRQILGNLIVYIIHRTPPGGRIELRIRPAAGALELECAQRGEGVRAPDPELLLEPFWQAAGEGLGEGNTREPRLGMALVFRLVELHGGVITVEQEDMRTARYRLLIPELATAEADA